MPERRSLAVALCVVAGLSLACATARPPSPSPTEAAARPAARPEPPAAPAEVTGLSFAVEPADAEVVIDGQSAGTVASLPRSGVVPLPPGLYQVSLKRAGFATWRAEVAVRSGVQPIRVTLAHP
jgi:hypothetical protein